VRPFLKSADLVVAPLLIARGVQNKVLEAMAMACPVVATPGAATGIDAAHGEHLIISSPDPQQLLAAIDRLLADPLHARAMGEAARRFVLERMSWDKVETELAELVRGAELPIDAA
jgi:polysaccharide biosynthesis protein PslH